MLVISSVRTDIIDRDMPVHLPRTTPSGHIGWPPTQCSGALLRWCLQICHCDSCVPCMGKAKHMHWDYAFELLKSKRSLVCPNPGFQAQVQLWQGLDCCLLDHDEDDVPAVATTDQRQDQPRKRPASQDSKPNLRPVSGNVTKSRREMFWRLHGSRVKLEYGEMKSWMQWVRVPRTAVPNLNALADVSRPLLG